MEKIRIQEIVLENFKNIENGKLELGNIDNLEDFFEESKIIGIYGQNGSGKTSIIDSAEILKSLFKGEKLTSEVLEFISKNSDYMSITVTLYIENNSEIKLLEYYVKILKSVTIENGISHEKPEIYESLKIKEYTSNRWESKKILIQNNEIDIKPASLIKNSNLIDLNVAKILNKKSASSFIFSVELMDILMAKQEIFSPLIENISFLKNYGVKNLYIINNRDSSLINANILIPINFRHQENNLFSQGAIPISLNETTFLREKELKLVQDVVNQMNIVLESLIPNLNIRIKEFSKDLDKEMSEGTHIKLVSFRNGMEIPLKYESDGIKKIISLLGTLIVVYNDPSFTLFIDEFDAAIFEYLLGEILHIIEKFAVGQLIFTSHNLRPLEILEKKHLRFTTIDSKDKYIKIPNIKQTNNLRNVYFREIFLDEGIIKLYKGNSSSKIRRSFFLAGSNENE